MSNSRQATAIVALVIVFSSSMCVPSQVRADVPPTSQPAMPDAGSLVDLAPSFRFGGVNFTSFRLTGYSGIAPDLGMDFDVAIKFDKPGPIPSDQAIYVSDAADHTPILLAAEGRVLLYDAASHRVIVGTPPGVSFVIKSDTDSLTVRGSLNETANLSRVEIDVPSIFANCHDFHTQPVAGGFQLTGVSGRGSTVTAQIDLTKKCPYQFLTIKAAGGSPVFLRIDKIAIDEPTRRETLAFPSVGQLKSRLPVTEFQSWWKDRGKDDRPIQGLAFRGALRNPDGRAQWEERYGKVDWKQAALDDATLSAALRDIVGRR